MGFNSGFKGLNNNKNNKGISLPDKWPINFSVSTKLNRSSLISYRWLKIHHHHHHHVYCMWTLASLTVLLQSCWSWVFTRQLCMLILLRSSSTLPGVFLVVLVSSCRRFLHSESTMIIHIVHKTLPADPPRFDNSENVSMAQDGFNFVTWSVSILHSVRRVRFFRPYFSKRLLRLVHLQFPGSRFQLHMLPQVLWTFCTVSHYFP